MKRPAIAQILSAVATMTMVNLHTLPAEAAPVHSGSTHEAKTTAHEAKTAPNESKCGAHDPHFTGMADYYHHSLYGRRTASGQVLQKHLYTAAHRTLPFGTHVHVKNHSNGRSCVVVINDRGPYTKSKVIDLSHSAAEELGMISAGTCKVGCSVVPKPKSPLISDEKPLAKPQAKAPTTVASAPVKQVTIKTTSVSADVQEPATLVSTRPTPAKAATKPVVKEQEVAVDSVPAESNDQPVLWSKD